MIRLQCLCIKLCLKKGTITTGSCIWIQNLCQTGWKLPDERVITSRWKSCKEIAHDSPCHEVNIAWNNDICPKDEAAYNVEWKKKCKKVIRP